MKAWIQSLEEKYSSSVAHTFVLHGNINDYVEGDKPLREYLAGDVFGKRSMIIFYDRSKGISFYTPAMRKEFLDSIDYSSSDANSQAQARQGRKELGEKPNAMIVRDPQRALPLIEEIVLHPDKQGEVMVFIEYPELIWAASDYSHMPDADRVALATLLRWANESAFATANNPIILSTRVITDLHPSLRAASNKLEAVEIPYPITSERLEYINYLLETREGVELDENITPQSFAALTGGLSCILIEDIALRALQTKRPLSTALVKERKDSIVESEFSGILEIVNPDLGFESVGGLEHVKNYLTGNVIGPMRGTARKQRAGRGVLFTGPPGTGKTLMALALAKEAQVNFVKLNIGRLLNAYVGTSERNLELALSCIRSLKPTIIFIDEIDQQLQRGGAGDSGVSRRIFARILDAMSTNELGERGEIFWIAATNKIATVDPALRRQGRFNKIIPFMPGSPKERADTVKAVLKKNNVGISLKDPQKETALIVKEMDGYTGSDIEGVCIKAMELAEDEDHSEKITSENLLYALQVIPPSTPKNEMDEMVQESIAYSNDLTLLPDSLREDALKRLRPPAQQMRLLLFDIDHTLLRRNQGHSEAYAVAFQEVYGVYATKDMVPHQGKTEPQIITEVMLYLGVPKAEAEAGLQRCMDTMSAYFEAISEHVIVEPFPGVVESIKKLAQDPANILGLVTGNLEPIAHIKLARAGLDSYFSVGGFGSDHSERAKLARIAIIRAQAEFQKIYLFGDAPQDMQAARAVEAIAVGTSTGIYTDAQLLEAGAQYVISGVADIAEIQKILSI